MTASAQAPMRTADSSAIGSSSARRSRRRWTTGWRGGMPRLGGLGRRSTGGSPGSAPASSGRGPARRISWVNVISRLARRWAGGSATKLPRPGLAPDQAVLGEPLHRVPGRHPADPELGAQLGVGRQPLAGPQRRRSARAAPARSGGSAAGSRLGHGAPTGARPAAARSASAASAPWTAAPIAPGPRPELGRHELDLVERRRVDAPPELGPDGLEQQVAGRRDPAADHDPVGRDDRDHVGDPDAEVATDLGQALERPRVAGPGRARPPPRPSRSRRRRRSGRPGRRPRGSRGCRSRTTARPGRSSGGRSRRPSRRGPGGPGRRSAMHAADAGPERQADHRVGAPRRRPAAARRGRTPGRR